MAKAENATNSVETPTEINVAFTSKAQLDEWTRLNKWAFSVEKIDAAVAYLKTHGAHSDCLSTERRQSVILRSKNHRESLIVGNLNSRQRPVLELVQSTTSQNLATRTRIHLHESVTPFALRIKGSYPYTLASEYLPDQESLKKKFPNPHVDICDSRLPDESFDLIVSQEVLEHVPNIDKAFVDMERILRSNGCLIASFPFRQNSLSSLKKAMIGSDGSLHHLMEPECHGNPVDPDGGSLVFEVPGWDVLDRLRNSGFETAAIHLVGSRTRGILSSNMFGVLVAVAKKRAT